nr:hypothetical protein [Tanacetum cinerariifolium]
EEYCRLPPLPLCFQNPQLFNSISHNVENEVEIDSMTLDEYDLYMAIQCLMKSKIQVPTQEIGAKNIRRTKHEVQNRCDDKTVDITDYEDSDQEDDELPDLPTFSVTNVFASFCEQIDENIDISVAKEIEEVQVEDVEMDKKTRQ